MALKTTNSIGFKTAVLHGKIPSTSHLLTTYSEKEVQVNSLYIFSAHSRRKEKGELLNL